MDFIKKHYEKVVLGVVLVGLMGAVAYLAFIKIPADKQALEDKASNLTHPRVQPLTNLDLTASQDALKLMASTATIDFGPPNRLFNPMTWQKASDGHLVPQEKVGPTRLAVTNIIPLYLRITYESPSVGDTGAKYQISVEKEATNKPKHSNYCRVGDKNDTFSLVEVKGKPEDPSQLIIQLNDTNERGVITKDKPYLRVDGYMADLYYDLEKKSFSHRRVGAVLPFNGEDYKIVAINQDEVILQAPNGKKWTIKHAPAVASNNVAP